MSLRTYDFKCPRCERVQEECVEYDERKDIVITCSFCADQGIMCHMAYQFPVNGALGFQPFETYFDPALDCDVHGRREQKQILNAIGFQEAGDPVKGARKLDKKAPHHIRRMPERGVRFNNRPEPGTEDMDVAFVDKEGKGENVSIHDLRNAGS